jgi:predicted PurR-regulated permease PerM
MTSLEIVGLVAIILISAFAIIGIVVSIPLFKLINRLKFLAGKLNESLVPIVEKLNNTVSHLNSEINSISELTQNVSSIVEQLEKIIRLARIILTNPIIKLISAGVGLASGVKKARGKEKSQEDK